MGSDTSKKPNRPVCVAEKGDSGWAKGMVEFPVDSMPDGYTVEGRLAAQGRFVGKMRRSPKRWIRVLVLAWAMSALCLVVLAIAGTIITILGY